MVLSEGVGERTGLSIGVTTFLVSLVVLLMWLPLREKPGLGTIANIVVIASAIDVMLLVLPRPEHVVTQFLFALAGVLIIGLGSALYLTAGLGPGPRDGWMTAIHHRSGLPVGRVRLFIEIAVLAVGFVLGGTVGVGTLLFALLIGRSIALWLAVVGRFAGA